MALLGTGGPESAGWDIGAYPDESSSVQAVVDMAGPSDLLTIGQPGRRRSSWPRASSHLLGNVPHKQLGADLKQASPTTYVAAGDPPFLILDSNNDEIVYPAAVAGARLGPRGWRACPISSSRCSDGGPRVRPRRARSPRRRQIIADVVDFFVARSWRAAPQAPDPRVA